MYKYTSELRADELGINVRHSKNKFKKIKKIFQFQFERIFFLNAELKKIELRSAETFFLQKNISQSQH
jgi:hypothetical protein